MTQPSNAAAKLVDNNNNPQIADRQAPINDLVDSTGGTIDGTLSAVSGSGADSTINDNFAELNTKINIIIDRLEAHGLIADN